MRKLLAVAIVLASPLARAGVDGVFPRGIAGAEWNSSLAALQRLHPEGFLNPIASSAIPYLFVVPGPHKELLLHVPIKAVSYAFDSAGRLRVVYVQIDASDPDAALYDLAEALGEDYITEDVKKGRNYQWKPGATTLARMQIARTPPRLWIQLILTNVADKTVVSELERCD